MSEAIIRGGVYKIDTTKYNLKSLVHLSATQRNNRIEKEEKALAILCKSIPEGKKEFANKIIARAAFMSFTLDMLEEQINVEGAIEEFVNGSQKMLREHPAQKTYNTMIKNYLACIKALSDLLTDEGGDKDDAIQALLNKKKKRRDDDVVDGIRGGGSTG